LKPGPRRKGKKTKTALKKKPKKPAKRHASLDTTHSSAPARWRFDPQPNVRGEATRRRKSDEGGSSRRSAAKAERAGAPRFELKAREAMWVDIFQPRMKPDWESYLW
jgi:hypothetical protein